MPVHVDTQTPAALLAAIDTEINELLENINTARAPEEFADTLVQLKEHVTRFLSETPIVQDGKANDKANDETGAALPAADPDELPVFTYQGRYKGEAVRAAEAARKIAREMAGAFATDAPVEVTEEASGIHYLDDIPLELLTLLGNPN